VARTPLSSKSSSGPRHRSVGRPGTRDRIAATVDSLRRGQPILITGPKTIYVKRRPAAWADALAATTPKEIHDHHPHASPRAGDRLIAAAERAKTTATRAYVNILGDLTIAAALRGAAPAHRGLVACGDAAIVGPKIGMTHPRQVFAVSQLGCRPTRFRSAVRRHADGERCHGCLREAAAPKVEAEIAFILADDSDGGVIGVADPLAAG